MLTQMLDLLKSEVLWTALGSIVALVAVVAPVYLLLRRRRLQRILNDERRFYETIPHGQLQNDMLRDYLGAVDRSVTGLESLPTAERQKAREKLVALIGNLRSTHESLVKAIQPFSLADAKAFLDGFYKFQADFSSLYHAGSIPSDARTHCHDVCSVVSEMSSMIDRNASGWEDIEALQHSVVSYDVEVIVPIMVSVFERSQREISLIERCLRDGDRRKAIWLKERYWFDMKPLYQSISTTLDKMSSLANQLSPGQRVKT
jgi:hypothetical protein